MSEFTDLVATAVANAQNRGTLEASRGELSRLAEEQAALRRVATLVARGIDPAEIFSAVAEEIRRLLGADNAGMSRFEPDGTSVVVVGDYPLIEVGKLTLDRNPVDYHTVPDTKLTRDVPEDGIRRVWTDSAMT